MSFKKAIVSSVAAAALATSAFAGMGTIQVAADKTGDYLLFPAYYANSAGWKTDLRVVNTNTTASVVAKVVIRDARQSEEKIDFLIYLTPGDVWSGLIYESAGSIHISSSDDSLVIGGVPANESPVDLVFPAASNGQVITSGYVEVFGLVQTDDPVVPYYKKGATTTSNEDLGEAPVDKRALYQWFTTSTYNLSTAPAEKREVYNNDLTGQAVVYADNTNGQLAMTTPATALEGFMGDAYPDDAAYIAANIVGKDTLLSNHVIGVASQTKYTSKCELIDEYEAAIAKYASYVIHYGDTTVDESALLALFPTKKYRLQEPSPLCTIGEIFEAKTAAQEEYNWAQSSDYMVTYSQTPRDMMENTPSTPPPGEISGGDDETIDPDQCDRELCQVAVENSVGAQGYVTYVFTGEAENNSTVVSPMPYDTRVMTAKNVGGANVTNMISPAFVGGSI